MSAQKEEKHLRWSEYILVSNMKRFSTGAIITKRQVNNLAESPTIAVITGLIDQQRQSFYGKTITRSRLYVNCSCKSIDKRVQNVHLPALYTMVVYKLKRLETKLVYLTNKFEKFESRRCYLQLWGMNGCYSAKKRLREAPIHIKAARQRYNTCRSCRQLYLLFGCKNCRRFITIRS